MRTITPSLDLYYQVRAGFVRRNTSLTAWCRENATHQSNARTCLTGSWDGPAAKVLRARICKAAGLDVRAAA